MATGWRYRLCRRVPDTSLLLSAETIQFDVSLVQVANMYEVALIIKIDVAAFFTYSGAVCGPPVFLSWA